MANRDFIDKAYALVKGKVELFAVVNIGASGAPTLQQWAAGANGGTYSAAGSGGWQGIKSITRNSTGNYTLVLQDPYLRLLPGSQIGFQPAAAGTAVAPIAQIQTTSTNVGSSTSPQVTFQCQSAAGSAADPASGEVMLVQLILQNSGAL